MNFDKKRRARVQGGWAAPNTNRQNGTSRPSSSSTVKTTQHNKNGDCTEISETPKHATIHSARSETEKAKVPPPPMPIWVGKNIDQQIVKQKFVYEEPVEVRVCVLHYHHTSKEGPP